MKMGQMMGATVGVMILAGSVLASSPAPRPNILYLYADDLGWGVLKANTGSDTLTKTPTIDSLAAAGLNFRRAYGCMVCSPARSTQQTGFHQGHTWTDRNDPDSHKKAMRKDDKTIGDMLNAAGYRVGYYGKWGYGAASTLVDPALQNMETLPVNHGYTDLLAELHHVRAHTYFQPSLWFNNIDTQGMETTLKYNDNVGGQKKEYADDLYAEAAEAFIRAHANGSQPFFCEIAFQVPHTPLPDVAEMPGWFDDYADVDTSTWPTDAKQYAAMITRQDHHIADLLAALDDPNGDGNTNDSVRANTLIIFASDNGGQGGTPHTFFDTNANLIGTKGSVKEGGIRVPTVFVWDGVIAPGQTTDRITCVSDVLPTLCELAGILPPTGIDGVSIAPLLMGQGQPRVRPWFTHESGSTWSLIRSDGIKLRNTGALYNLADGGNTNYEATDLLANPSDPMYPTYLQWKNEMQAIAMAERVTEPYGFANTYHHWIGANGARASEAANWSDYIYANNGITYISETGAPRERWVATLANTGTADQTAQLDADISVLGIEIAGNPATESRQTLAVDFGRTLSGRNEIRLSPWSDVQLNGGVLASVRWVDLFANATIQGPGTIDAILYNAGTLDITTNWIETTTYTTNIIPGSGDGGVNIVLNGGFEEGDSFEGDADYSYNELHDWGTDGVDKTKDGAKASKAYAGTYRGLMTGVNNLVQDTGSAVQTGKVYRLAFYHSGFAGWDATDTIDVELFYDNGARQTLFSFNLNPTPSVWNLMETNFPAITNPAAAGQNMWIKFSSNGGSTEFVSLDEVSLAIPDQISPAITNIVTNVVNSVGLVVLKDYHQAETAQLDVPLFGSVTSLVVNGIATLDGRLECLLPAGFSAAVGDRFTVLSASSITGTFNNPDGMIEQDGHHFRIHYFTDRVELEKVAVTLAGTPHWWMDEHGLTNNSYEVEEQLDVDGDGLSAGEEYIAGTSPIVGSSVLLVESETTLPVAGFMVKWSSVAGRVYHLYSGTNLSDGFALLQGNIPARPPENTYTDLSETAHGFYRVQAERK